MSDDPRNRRYKRCFHRISCGLERGGELRLLTLTSSDQAPRPIRDSWRRLIARLRRRGLAADYAKVIETKDNGRQHIHVVVRGRYIAQAMLSAMWADIHLSPVVDIRQVHKNSKDRGDTAGYLSKYMAKDATARYSWSRSWVYPGFVEVWKAGKRIINVWWMRPYGRQPFLFMLRAWQHHLRSHSPPRTFYHDLWSQTIPLQNSYRPAPVPL